MQCPDCGYLMSDLDKECLRCKRLGVPSGVAATAVALFAAQEKECPRCGKATTLSAPTCDKCGYVYGSERAKEELSYALPAAALAPLNPLPQEPASPLLKTVPPVLGWSVLLASLAVAGGLAWYMIGGADVNSVSVGDDDTASTHSAFRFKPRHHHHKPVAGKAAHQVMYEITGTAASVNVTYQDATGATQKLAGVALPWTQAFQAPTGTPLHVAAQDPSGTGIVNAEIDVDKTPRKQTASSAASPLADASDTL